MPSKKGKAKVSQADLRKMMQEMKSKKVVASSSFNGKTPTFQQSSLKRTLTHDRGSNQIVEPKRLKGASDIDIAKSAMIKPMSSQKIQKPNDVPSLKHNVAQKRSYPSVAENMTEATKQPPVKLQKVTQVKKQSGSAPLVSGFYSGSDSDSSADEEKSPTKPLASQSSLGSSSKKVPSQKASAESSLPAGFFDDPETDAKMRGVETPADKMDREWDSFKRELQHETGQSEQLIDEDQETGHLDREIDEIDTQIQYYHLVDKLCDKKDTALHKMKEASSKDLTESDDSSSSADEDDVILDWREKDAFT